MNKKMIIIVLLVISLVTIVCGCIGEEQKALTKGEESGQLKIQSSVVELYQSSFNFNTKIIKDTQTDQKYEIVDNIEVKYLLKNIAGRPIHVKVTAEFYDKNDKLVGIIESGSIYLPKDHTEKSYTTQNSIIYNGDNVADVQYALLIIDEIV